MGVGAGDKLARGGAKASFPPAGGNVTQEVWDRIWEGYRSANEHREVNSGDTDVEAPRNVSVDSGENKSNS